MHIHTKATQAAQVRTHRTGFTLVELLVVIGIIGLLVGLLLPALGRAMERARVTSTQGTMQEFSKACDAYYAEFNEYPGIIPEDALAAGMSGNDGSAPPISSTENALLALMGGYRLPTDADYTAFPGTVLTFATTPVFTIKVNGASMGEGPWRNGRKYDSFFSPKGREFGAAKGQMNGTSVEDPQLLPDLLDSWGQPIIYVRNARSLGPLVGTTNPPGQFSRAGILPYTLSTGLGELGNDQTLSGNTNAYSVLNTNGAASLSDSRARDLTLGQLMRHPAQTTSSATANDAAKVDAGSPRGKYILISAGTDGIYFSAAQGRGNPAAPQGDVVSNGTNPQGPVIVELYDDILMPGGA